MGDTRHKESINSTKFSEAEIKMYDTHLSQKIGSKQKAINISGLSSQSFFRAMRGEVISKKTKQKITKAIMQVIQKIQAQ